MPFPHYINNTMLKAFRACPTKFMRRHIKGLTPLDEGISIDLHFGASFAAGLEAGRRAFFENQERSYDAIAEAIEAAVGHFQFETPQRSSRSAKTEPNLVASIQHYFKQWELDTDNLVPIKYGIEMPFHYPLGIANPDTGEEICFVGRADMVARDKVSNNLVLVDDKTTGSFSDVWYLQWDMDAQVTGYIWALKQIYPDETITAQIRAVKPGIYGPETTCVMLAKSEHQLQQWYAQMIRDVARMIKYHCDAVPRWDLALGNACVEYGRQCEYTKLCMSPDSTRMEEQMYKIQFWNPVLRNNTNDGV